MKEMLKQLELNGIIPVLKFETPETAVPTCKALMEGGLRVAEITFRTAAAEEAIRRVAKELPDMLVGAGTVVTTEQAKRAMEAGAKFIVTPGFNPAVVSYCVEQNMPIVPGVNNPGGIEQAMGFGLTCVKFFPAEASGGVKFLKAVRGPYGGMQIIPTGGVGEDNLQDYLSTPGVIACGGSWMAPTSAIESGDYETIRALTAKAVQKMLGLRVDHVGVNAGNEKEAAVKRLSTLLGATDLMQAGVEMMDSGRGRCGHIGLAVHNLDRAVYYLEQSGWTFAQDSIKLDKAGKTKVIYMNEEVAGFAIHLLRKS